MKKKGRKIKTFEQLLLNEKSVWVSLWNRPSPMAFIVSLPFRIVNRYLKNGYFYETKERK